MHAGLRQLTVDMIVNAASHRPVWRCDLPAFEALCTCDALLRATISHLNLYPGPLAIANIYCEHLIFSYTLLILRSHFPLSLAAVHLFNFRHVCFVDFAPNPVVFVSVFHKSQLDSSYNVSSGSTSITLGVVRTLSWRPRNRL